MDLKFCMPFDKEKFRQDMLTLQRATLRTRMALVAILEGVLRVVKPK